MGSPLGVLFANFFMGCVEEEVFKTTTKPAIYCRYIDDIFMKTETAEDIQQIKTKLQHTSGLNFTVEHASNGKMPFLDILIHQENIKFTTDVHVKSTNTGHCLNGKSECPQRYKESTISAYIRRALSHCTTWNRVHDEIKRATQVLTSNGYNICDVERQTKKIIDKWYTTKENNKDKEDLINIYYKALFSTSYKEEERNIKQIIKRNVTPTNTDKKM